MDDPHNAVVGEVQRQRKRLVDDFLSSIGDSSDLGHAKKRPRRFQRIADFEGDKQTSPMAISPSASSRDTSSGSDSCHGYDDSSISSHEQKTGRVLESMVKGIFSSDDDEQLKAITWFRRHMSIDTVQEVIDAGVVPFFVQFLESENPPKLQFQAAWVLTNIADEGTKKASVIVENDGVPKLLKLLGSTNDKVREQAVWALRNIAVQSDEYYLLVLNNGFLTSLLELLRDYKYLSNLEGNKKQVKMDMLVVGFVALAVLSQFERGREKPSFEKFNPALPILASLIHLDHERLLSLACKTLLNLLEGEEQIEAMFEAGVFHGILKLLESSFKRIITYALRILNCIVDGSDKQIKDIVNLGALYYLGELLKGNYSEAIEELSCQILSRIIRDSEELIGEFFRLGISESLICLLRNSGFTVKKQAVQVLAFATAFATEDQIELLVTQGCIELLCNFLDCSDPQVVGYCLDVLEDILKAGNAQGVAVNQYAESVHEFEGFRKMAWLKKFKHRENSENVPKVIRILSLYDPVTFI